LHLIILNYERIGEYGRLTSETYKYIFDKHLKTPRAGLISIIYMKRFEQGKGIRYYEMQKLVTKELDRVYKGVSTHSKIINKKI